MTSDPKQHNDKSQDEQADTSGAVGPSGRGTDAENPEVERPGKPNES